MQSNVKIFIKYTATMVLITLTSGILAGCNRTTSSPTAPGDTAKEIPETYTVNLDPADFVEAVYNPYFLLLPGTIYIYEAKTQDKLERVEVEVLDETKLIMGITASIVRDTVYLDGELIEDTFDWYAQDKDGNVWYMGEAVKNYENGQFTDTAGSWEAGVNGALPGIIMYADPAVHVGETYQQEYYQGEAEDMAEVLSAKEHVNIPFGTYDQVVQTKDFTPLEPDVIENKYYARGIGLIKTVDLSTGEE